MSLHTGKSFRALFQRKQRDGDSHSKPRTAAKTYRVHGIPLDCDRQRSKTLLEACLGFGDGQSDIKIHSLAHSPSHRAEKIATITSIEISDKLSSARQEWNVKIPRQWDASDDDLIREITIDTHFEGFTPLNSLDKEDNHKLDCIALSGLGGHAFGSFKQRGGDYMWLRDALPLDLKFARILIYGYDTKITDSTSFQDLEGLASTFRTSIMSIRRQQRRPIIFIAHSLGGLVLKEAIIQMSRDQRLEAVTCLNSTYGILLFGCPNQGMDVSSLIPMCEGQVNISFLLSLRQSSEQLRTLCREFPNAFAFSDSRIISFYETKLSPTAREGPDGIWTMTGPLAVLVNESSATHGRPGEDKAHDMQAINRSHSEMVKFGRRDLDYEVVLYFLKDFVASACHIIEARFRQLDGFGQLNSLQGSHVLTGVRTGSSSPRIHESNRYRDLVRWLAPNAYECHYYNDDLDDVRSLRHPGTCEWIHQKAEFTSWLNAAPGSTQSLLWLNAIPGAGKTVLSSYLVDHSTEISVQQPQPVVYFLFKFADLDKNTPLAAARALIHQLIQFPKLIGLEQLFQDLLQHMDSSGQRKAISFKPLWNLFCEHCAHLPHLTIILDALDECREIRHLLPGLIKLVVQGSAKVILTSRHEPDLVAELQDLPSLQFGAKEVQDDIEAYLKFKVSQSPVLSDLRVRSRIIRILNHRSRGMFLWVALMIKELESRTTIDEIEDTLSELPEGLPAVYKRILERLNSVLKPSRKRFCCKMLRWIVLAKRPLRLDEVSEALKSEYSRTSSGFIQNLLCQERELELACGSLVTVKNKAIQLIHLSTKEFLQNSLEASDLDGPLQDFFIDTTRDSARVATYCIAYLNPHCVAEKLSVDDPECQGLRRSCPLLEYASSYWPSHVIESTSLEMETHESEIRHFLQSSHSLYWVEIYLKMHHSCDRLRTLMQAVLEWSSLGLISLSESNSLEKTVPLFHYWAESYMQLLQDYGQSFQQQPSEVHSVDPARFCQPSRHQLLQDLNVKGLYERHIVIKKADIGHESLKPPAHRYLQRNTSVTPGFAFVHLDKREETFITLDEWQGNNPQIRCQEVISGRKLAPVPDPELEDSPFALRTLGACISPDAKHIGIVYHWFDCSGIDNQEEILYTAVWALERPFDFSKKLDRSPWARKVFSTTLTTQAITKAVNSCRPIVFVDDRTLYCPNGRVDIMTGVEEMNPRLLSCNDNDFIIYSGDGQTMVTFTIGSRILNFISNSGAVERVTIPPSVSALTLCGFSYSGRFAVWSSYTAGVEYRLIVCDRSMRRIRQLEGPSVDLSTVKVVFVKDDSILIGMLGFMDEIMRISTHIVVWMLQGDDFRLWATRRVRGQVSGFFVDEENRQLYIVSDERIWRRFDLDSYDLRDVDTDIGGDDFPRIEQQVSSDGKRLGLVILRPDLVNIQIFDLTDSRGEVLFARTMRFLPRNLQTSTILFSPTLDILFIDSHFIEVRSFDCDPLDLRDTPFTEDKSGDIQQTQLRYSFSACSKYFAVALELGTRTTDLRIYSIDMERRCCTRCEVQDIDLATSYRIGIDFHPYRPQLMLSYWCSNSTESDTPLVKCSVVDVQNCTISQLHMPNLDTNNFVECDVKINTRARYSVCGTYVFVAETLPLNMFIPGFLLDVSMQTDTPSQRRPQTISLNRPESWNQYSFTLQRSLSAAHSLELRIAKCDGSRVWQDKMLTIIPSYLELSHVTLLLDDERSEMRVLFFREDSVPEMKFLGFSFEEFIAGFEMLCDGVLGRRSRTTEVGSVARLPSTLSRRLKTPCDYCGQY